MVGQKVGQYQFLEKLGAGGMGEIYKAQDTRLNRFVAVKVLSTASAGDPERRRRFIQEAQAASALNHPNIITIHDIVSMEDSEFMVMEFVQGKTLVDLIPKGGLRLPQALKIAVQMTDALTAAHSIGIVHRDLKPANVMVTESGLVKVLDFGLAKLTDRGPVTTTGDATQTIADAPLTVEGSIIGTVSYMSPEQAQGKKVDTRSDIFSFGVVLYEMVTGVRAFGGDNALSTLSAILRDEAKPLAEVAPDVPPQIEQVIKRCLRKNTDDRWQSMQDVKAALTALKHESDSGQLYKPRIHAQAAAKKGMPKAAIAAGVGAVVLLGAAGGTALWIKRHRPPVKVDVAVDQGKDVNPAAQPVAQPIAATTPAPETTPAPAPPAEPVETVLNNDNIIELVTNKVPNAVIVNQIRASKTNFNLSPAELIRLTKAGVPGSLIEVMRNPKAAPPTEKASAPKTSPAPNKSASPEVLPPAPAPTAVAPPPAPVVLTPTPVPAAIPRTLEKITVVTIPDGAPLPITLNADVPAELAEGQLLRFVATQDFRAGDMVVVAKGAAVTGAVVEVGGKKKFLGMGGGKATFRLIQADAVDGRKLNIRSTPARGQGGQAQRPLEPPGKKPPKDLVAAAGAEYIGYIDGEQTVSVKK
jgi:serine/threonine-protein kinase